MCEGNRFRISFKIVNSPNYSSLEPILRGGIIDELSAEEFCSFLGIYILNAIKSYSCAPAIGLDVLTNLFDGLVISAVNSSVLSSADM